MLIIKSKIKIWVFMIVVSWGFFRLLWAEPDLLRWFYALYFIVCVWFYLLLFLFPWTVSHHVLSALSPVCLAQRTEPTVSILNQDWRVIFLTKSLVGYSTSRSYGFEPKIDRRVHSGSRSSFQWLDIGPSNWYCHSCVEWRPTGVSWF